MLQKGMKWVVGEEGSLNSREKEAKSQEKEGSAEYKTSDRPTDSQEFARKKKVPLPLALSLLFSSVGETALIGRITFLAHN